MKIMWFTIATGLFILFSFQNCQKSPSADELQLYAKNAVIQSGKVSTISLADQKLTSFEFISKDQEQIIKNGTAFTILTNNTYHLDFLTGVMTSDSEFTQAQKRYCLTDSLKNELASVLESSSICPTLNTKAANQICSQALVAGYAKITTDLDQYELGAATDGCGNNEVDLCGDSASLLKGFIFHLKSQLNSLSCD